MGNWENVELGSVCEVVRGGSPRPIIDYITDDPDGVNWLKIGDVKETDKFFTHAAERIKRSGIPKTREVHAGDLILSNSMSFGRAFITLIDGYIHDGWLRLRCNEERLDKEFLYYFLTSNLAQNQFKAVATGSVVNNLKSDTVKAVRIDLPPLEEQRRIAAMLSMIDAKIKCNEEINENLAQQAQAIYADIFITNADPAWPLGHLSDLITVRYGKDHKKLNDGPFPVYGSGGVMRYVERPIYEKESVLIPRKGTLNNVMYVNKPFWSVDTMFFTEMKLPDVAKFVFHFVKSKDLASLNAGSAVPSMTTDILNAMELSIPDAETLKRFESIVGPMYRAMQHNSEESKKLAAVRDSLLPRLMSGELDVSALDS